MSIISDEFIIGFFQKKIGSLKDFENEIYGNLAPGVSAEEVVKLLPPEKKIEFDKIIKQAKKDSEDRRKLFEENDSVAFYQSQASEPEFLTDEGMRVYKCIGIAYGFV